MPACRFGLLYGFKGECMKLNKLLFVVLLSGSVVLSSGANSGAMLKSVLFPGIGQMSSGGKHTYIGMGFMVAEVMALQAVFNATSKASAFQKGTVLYSSDYVSESDYDKKMEIRGKWVVAYDNAQKQKKMATVWGAVAAGVWASSMLESLFFAPSKDKMSVNMNEHKVPVLSLLADGSSFGVKVAKGF